METIEKIIIEVVDCTNIPEHELAEFQETKPIKIEEVTYESQEILITKYVNGEVSFPTFYTTLEDGDEPDDDQDYIKQTINDSTSSNSSSSNNEPPSSTLKPSRQFNNINLQSPIKKEKRTSATTSSGSNSTITNNSSTGGGSRRRSILNPALQGLMGEANLCFARGQNEMTEKICLEIIRQNPLAPEPFFTLAQIYETKDIEKFLNFSTIAAHLDPSNRDQWIRIAEINIEMKNYQQARIYYSKAMRHLSKDFDLRLKKAKLLELMGETRDAMITYLKMIPLVPIEHGNLCLQTAKKVARYYYDIKKMQLALEAMLSAYNIIPLLFMSEEINLLLELLIINQNYHKGLQVLRDHCQIDIIIEKDHNSDDIIIKHCHIPNNINLLPEFLCKLSVCIVHCKAYEYIKLLIQLFFIKIQLNNTDNNTNNDNIEFYMDFVEALMKQNQNNDALYILNHIVNLNDFLAPAYVWLRLAECYYSLNLIENSIKSYYKVIEMAPLWYDAKFTLSALLKKQNRHLDAIQVLEQNFHNDTIINPRLLYERCLMFNLINNTKEYINIGYTLLSRNSLKFRSREEMIACSQGGNNFNADTYKSIVETRFDTDIVKNEPEYNEIDSNLSIDDEYELFKNLIQTIFTIKDYGQLQKLTIAIATSKRFRSKYREIEKIIMISSLYNNDTLISFYYFREILTKNITNNNLWNFLIILIQKGDETRYHRFCKRIFDRYVCEKYLRIILGNYHLISGSYKYALNIYIPILNEYQDALASLCSSVCFTQISLQKNSLKKSTGVGHAIAFMKKYAKLRKHLYTEQEIYYNLGRIHHQAGAIHLALHYYEKGLNIKYKSDDEFMKKHSNILDLQAEIAFNVHLIYKDVGNMYMARKYLYKYVVI